MRQPFSAQHLVAIEAGGEATVVIEDLLDQPVLFDAHVLVASDAAVTVNPAYLTDYGASEDADWNGLSVFEFPVVELDGQDAATILTRPFLRTYDVVAHPIKHSLILQAGAEPCNVRLFVSGTVEASYHHTPAIRTV